MSSSTAPFLNLCLWVRHPLLTTAYWHRFRRLPNIANPETVSEKFLWRKIFDRNPRIAEMSDKLKAKSWIAENYPQLKRANVLWQGTDIREAPPELLHGHAYLKANHASGFNLHLNGDVPDIEELHKLTQSWLGTKWHKQHGEWGYTNVKPTLFIEEYIGTSPEDLDVLVFTFGNTVSHLHLTKNLKRKGTRFGRFGPKLNRMPLGEYKDPRMQRLARGNATVEKISLPMDFQPPLDLPPILELAGDIGSAFDCMRVDLFWNGSDYYFMELTAYPFAGYVLHSDERLLKEMAEDWDLRRSWFLSTPQQSWRRWYANWLRRVISN